MRLHIVKNSNSELFLSERTEGTKIEKSLMERRSRDMYRSLLKGRTQVLTIVLSYSVLTNRGYHDFPPKGPTGS